MESRQVLRLVQRQQRLRQHDAVLVLDGHGETVDDGRQDFQQLCDAVVLVALQRKVKEDVADGAPQQRPPLRKLGVDAMRDCLHT